VANGVQGQHFGTYSVLNERSYLERIRGVCWMWMWMVVCCVVTPLISIDVIRARSSGSRRSKGANKEMLGLMRATLPPPRFFSDWQ
jgi:hypothetical protein